MNKKNQLAISYSRLSNNLEDFMKIVSEIGDKEAELYANAMETAGVATEYICYDGMIHGFFGMTPAVDKAKLAMEDACNSLRKAFTNKT